MTKMTTLTSKVLQKAKEIYESTELTSWEALKAACFGGHFPNAREIYSQFMVDNDFDQAIALAKETEEHAED